MTEQIMITFYFEADIYYQLQKCTYLFVNFLRYLLEHSHQLV